jgi:uncharacterized membrane protein YdjX (TVP38/TMEM64 family)
VQAFLLDLLMDAQGSPGLGRTGLAAAAFMAALAFVPRNLVSLIGGFLFGWITLPITVVAGTCGSITASFLARRLLRARLSAHADARPAWRALLTAIDQEGWRAVALLRLAGPLPCSAQGYLLGLTGIPITTIAAVSLLGAVPQSALFVYFGTLGQVLLSQGVPGPLRSALLGSAAVSLVALVTLVGRRARRILAQAAQPA